MLNQSAFALGGILSFLSFCLKFFFDRKQVKQIIFVCTAILAILYSFPLLLVQRIILHLLDKRCDRLSVKYGIGFSVIMIIYPESVISAAFLIPCMFRLTRYYSVQTKRVSLIFGMIIQSILFQSINIIQTMAWMAIKAKNLSKSGMNCVRRHVASERILPKSSALLCCAFDIFKS